jgi:tetratricopeptide (TPR) repeat protein
VAAAVGLTWWGVNSLASTFGCGDYSNPYNVEGSGGSYSEPVVTMPVDTADEESGRPAGVSQEVIDKFDQARAAFRERDYAKALKLTDEAIGQLPHDAVLHEFRSLILFALGRYTESAAAIHAVLAVGPGWNDKTLTGLYPDMDTYTAHLRALEAARNKDPKMAEFHFLLGYHYLTCGYPKEALTEFTEAATLLPKDAVTASLVATLSPRDAKPAAAPAEAAAPPVLQDTLAGAWTAGKGTSTFALNLGKDGTFTWAFTRGSRKEQVKGVYTVEGNVLAMEPDTGGVLLAELTVKGTDDLHFQMIGGAKDDPGLKFRRGQM